MPELGKYVTEVLSAYAITVLLLTALVCTIVIRARRVRRELNALEAQITAKGARHGD